MSREGARLSQPGWMSRACRALVGREPLPRTRCLQVCAIMGAWTGGAAALALLLGATPPSWVTGVTIQASVGVGLLVGAALSWVWPPASRPYLLLVGVTLVGAVAWYPFFMALMDRGQSGVKHFGHAPGLLAMGLAFGFRLLVDLGVPNEETRRALARYAGIAGLAIGACLDAFVLYRVMTAFFGARPA